MEGSPFVADGTADIRSCRMDWLIHHLQHEIIRHEIIQLYCDEVCQAKTSMPPAHVREVIFDTLHDANTIDETKDCKKVTTDGEQTMWSVLHVE